MKITVLGCGSAGGVPMIGNVWGKCDPAHPRNRRLRSSVLVEEGKTALLLDTSPDLRTQLLNCNLQRLDAVLYTHAHADHCHGIDDLRQLNWLTRQGLDIYGTSETLREIQERFAYIFAPPEKAGFFSRPSLSPKPFQGSFRVHEIEIMPIEQQHGLMRTTGYRMGRFAYCTDVSVLDEKALAALEGVEVWIVGCVRETPHPTHASLETILAWSQRLKPQRVYLTHMGVHMDYASLMKKLPKGVEPAYDGLEIQI